MATSKTSPTAGETNSTDDAPSGDVTPVIAVNDKAPDTSVASASASGDDVEPAPKMSELTGIRYIGTADVRRLSQEDLESLGVENPKQDLVWDASNGKIVPTEEFNAATRDALLQLSDFVVA